ncbi:hypothetical protein C8Q80DRAFT_260659 [Daedaleopsis nitida]|nr:hypothetical protein C8Q80DRAFT_260659 [Daedaleopsis nitida]
MAFQLQQGHTYKLTNTTSRAVLDLSMADFKSVVGSTWDSSDNQKWVAERARTSSSPTRWAFRSVATGLYLAVDGIPRAAARVIATRDETEWDVRPDQKDPSVLRIVVPNGRLGVQLGEKGTGTAKLSDKESEEQCWRFEEGQLRTSCTSWSWRSADHQLQRERTWDTFVLVLEHPRVAGRACAGGSAVHDWEFFSR